MEFTLKNEDLYKNLKNVLTLDESCGIIKFVADEATGIQKRIQKNKKSCWHRGLGCDNLIKLSRDNKEAREQSSLAYV